jgi:hypothetical protein
MSISRRLTNSECKNSFFSPNEQIKRAFLGHTPMLKKQEYGFCRQPAGKRLIRTGQKKSRKISAKDNDSDKFF